MSTIELLKPILEGGVDNPYFFNGRLLTAEDLQDEQEANRQHRQQLGRSIGEGVVNGMEVKLLAAGTKSTLPTVSITKGMALNREGGILELKGDIRLTLVREPIIPITGTGTFSPCKPMAPQLIPTGTGVYILASAPASGYKGRAPMHRLDDNGKISACNHRFEVGGVQFKLVYMDITNSSIASGSIGEKILNFVHKTGAANRSKLRNLLAHLCLGTGTAADFTTELFHAAGSSASVQGYGPLDVLREVKCLESTEVPLALILWTLNGLEFVDMWSVRRKVHSPYLFKDTPYPVTHRRTAELQAAHLQFQEHLTSLYRSSSDKRLRSGVRAKDYFCYLPGVGMIPLDSTEADKTNKNIKIKFFEDLTVRDPVFIEGVKLRHLISTSFSYDPIDLEEKELTWLYRVRQNMEFIDNNPTKAGQAYLVFSSGYIPFQGEAQYDLSRFDYSNYGPGVADKFIIGG
jgi:hypothetical protein